MTSPYYSPRFSKYFLATRKLLQLANAQLIALEEFLGCTVDPRRSASIRVEVMHRGVYVSQMRASKE